MPVKGYRDPNAKPRSKRQRGYNLTKDQTARRSSRNKARRKLKCPSGKDVHHKDGNPRNNKRSNLACSSVKNNRSKNKRR